MGAGGGGRGRRGRRRRGGRVPGAHPTAVPPWFTTTRARVGATIAPPRARDPPSVTTLLPQRNRRRGAGNGKGRIRTVLER